MARTIAGNRSVPVTVTTDLGDLVATAVRVERARLVSEIRAAVRKLPTEKSTGSYSSSDRKAHEFRADVLAELDRAERSEGPIA